MTCPFMSWKRIPAWINDEKLVPTNDPNNWPKNIAGFIAEEAEHILMKVSKDPAAGHACNSKHYLAVSSFCFLNRSFTN